MKTYKVYKHPNNTIKVVKLGWSWTAFFFSIFWALFNKMWLYAFIIFAINFIMGKIESGLGYSINLLFWCALGYYGNILKEKFLVDNGYLTDHIIYEARNESHAESLYFQEINK